jgi:hypothetical protein
MFGSPDTIGRANQHNTLIHLVNRLTGMSTSQFTLSYDGEALKSGQMDVRDLAPALLAASDLLSEANRQVNQDRVTLSVSVQGGFEKGSFDITLVTNQGVLSQLASLVTGDRIIAASALVMLLFGGRGLLDLLKWLAGTKPERVEKEPNGDVRFTLRGSEMVINGNVYIFYENPSMRKAIKPIVNPLMREGIDFLRAIAEKKILLELEKKDVPSLAEIDMEEKVISDTEREAFLQIVSLSFKEDNKWRLWDGSNSSLYSIQDEEFLTDIDQHSKTFGKDDTLRCQIRSVVRLNRDGELKTELSVVRVVEHIRAPKQSRLFPSS